MPHEGERVGQVLDDIERHHRRIGHRRRERLDRALVHHQTLGAGARERALREIDAFGRNASGPRLRQELPRRATHLEPGTSGRQA